MAGRPVLWVGLMVLVAVLAVVAIVSLRPSSDAPQAFDHYPVSRQVQWELNVRNLTGQALREVEILSFLPLPDTWQQALISVTANHPLEQQLDRLQQPVGRIQLETIPPYGQRNVRFEAELALADDFGNHERTPIEHWLVAEALIESDHERIIRLAGHLRRADALQTTRAIYDWLVAEVTYGGYDPVDRGALHALDKREGDCTEYSALAVALARANGIPARLVNGYVMNEDGRLSPFAFHAWAEIRVDDRWLIVDAQERRFDPSPAHFLATHYGTSRSRSLDWTRFHSGQAGISIEMR